MTTFAILSLIPAVAYARTLTVSQTGSGNYNSIVKALAAAQPGDVIQVAAGTYTQGIIISKNNIRIEGEGYQKTRLVVKDDFAVRIQSVTECRIQGLSLYAQGNGGYSSVLIDNSKVVLRHCLVTSDPSGYGVSCFNKASLSLDHNTLVNNGKGGAVVFDVSSSLKIRNNIMAENAVAINYKGTGNCPAEIANNNIWGNEKDYIGCNPAADNFSEDPQFVDPKSGNYRLSANSGLLKKAADGQDMGADMDWQTARQVKNDADSQAGEELADESEADASSEENPGEEAAEEGTQAEEDKEAETAKPKPKTKSDEESVKNPTQIKIPMPKESLKVNVPASILPEKPVQEMILPPKVSLQISSSREAQVYIDSIQYSPTPVTINSLSPGKHDLKLAIYDKDAAFIYQSSIELNPGDNRIQADNFERIIPPARMVLVPAGGFEMGSEQGEVSEMPVHKVFVGSFYMDIYEVTNQQYRQYLQAKGLNIPDQTKFPEFSDPAQPASGVTWDEAQGYCQWLGKRLPTEAEWEKAARGNDRRVYPWGNDFAQDKAGVIINLKYPQPPGSYSKGASPYGVQDMAGNVWEWCSDWYQEDYYVRSPVLNPRGPDTGKYKILRGGAFDSPAYDVRTSRRWRYEPDLRRYYIGFRCVWQ